MDLTGQGRKIKTNYTKRRSPRSQLRQEGNKKIIEEKPDLYSAVMGAEGYVKKRFSDSLALVKLNTR